MPPPGTLINPRDERGWSIPRAGTKRRAVYDLIVLGWGGRDVYDTLKITPAAYRRHRQMILNPLPVYKREWK